MTETPPDNVLVNKIAELLSPCRNLLFITGAGISADSGLPTYRGIGGLYDVEDPEEGRPIEELLSGQMMQRRPELTWKYLARIAEGCRGSKFNRGHEVIAEMETHFERICVLTQNVDGFHRQAGSRNVIDIHGDLHELFCTQCQFQDTVIDLDGYGMPPRCLRCRGIMRPDVVLFGEMLPLEKVDRLSNELEAGFDLVFSIGTSSLFPYIAEPVHLARKAGIPTIEINPGQSEVSDVVDVKLSARAATSLDQIWAKYRETNDAS